MFGSMSVAQAEQPSVQQNLTVTQESAAPVENTTALVQNETTEKSKEQVQVQVSEEKMNNNNSGNSNKTIVNKDTNKLGEQNSTSLGVSNKTTN